MIQFGCPNCSVILTIAERKIGTSISCPKCGALATVPPLADDRASLPEPPGLSQLDLLRSIRTAAWVIAWILLAGIAVGVLAAAYFFAQRPSPPPPF